MTDGLPGVWLVRGAMTVGVFALVVGIALLFWTPTLSQERHRTAAAPPTVTSPAGTRPGAMPAPPPAAPGSVPVPAASPAPAAPPAAARTATATPRAQQRYTIQPGDTLLAVAERYDTTVDAIRAANPGLNENALQVGAEIMIPAGR